MGPGADRSAKFNAWIARPCCRPRSYVIRSSSFSRAAAGPLIEYFGRTIIYGEFREESAATTLSTERIKPTPSIPR